MRRVLMTITNSPYGFGGVSAWIERMTVALPAYGWKVTTVTQALDARHLADWAGRHPRMQLAPLYGKFARLDAIEPALERYLDLVRPDVVVINGSYWMMPTLQRRKERGERLRAIGVCHADENGYYRPLAFYRQAFDHIVAVSRTCLDRLGARGCGPARLTALPYGVPWAAALGPRAERGRLRVVYVGRLVQAQKRILDLARLVAVLNERRVNYRLDLVGAGPEEGVLREQVAAVDKEGRVTFHGWLAAGQLPERVWRNADVLVLASAYEGLSMSMLEAMGNGVVPVVTRVESGVGEVIREGETGFTYAVGDMPACAQWIALLASDRERLAEMSRAAWDCVRRNYSVEAHAERLAQIFKRVVSEAPQLGPARYRGVTARPLARLVPARGLVWARRWLKRGNPISEGYTTFP